MCNVQCIVFATVNLASDDVRGKRVLEAGAMDVNGTLRPILQSWKPAEYVGVDIAPGPGVDVVCDAEKLVEKFGENAFDLVVSTEMLEHVRDWRAVVSNLKRVCRPGGTILVTTRSKGFLYHAYPHDYWRYQPEDMKEIFGDCEIGLIEIEKGGQGVYVKVRKPAEFREKDLGGLNLYSMLRNRRVDAFRPSDFYTWFHFRCRLKEAVRNLTTFIQRLSLGICRVLLGV